MQAQLNISATFAVLMPLDFRFVKADNLSNC